MTDHPEGARPIADTNHLEGNLAALVHHVELSKAGWRDRAMESLILATCFSTSSPLTGEEIWNRLNEQLDAPIGRAQVESIIELLLLRASPVPSGDVRYKLYEEARGELEDNFSNAEALEEEVEATFEAHFVGVDEEPPRGIGGMIPLQRLIELRVKNVLGRHP